MAKKPETYIQQRTQELLNATFRHIWLFKVHGNMYQRAGVPDLVGCVQGVFFAIEAKTKTGVLDPLQEQTILEVNRAGGISFSFRSPEEAVEMVKWELRSRGITPLVQSPDAISEKLKSKRSRKTRLLSSWRRVQEKPSSRSE